MPPFMSSICHLGDALHEVQHAKAAGVSVFAETCPHYLVLTDVRYDDPDPASLRAVRHLAAPPKAREIHDAPGGEV